LSEVLFLVERRKGERLLPTRDASVSEDIVVEVADDRISAALPDLRSDELRWNGESLLAELSLFLVGVVVLGEGLPHDVVRSAANVFDLVGERRDVAGDLRDVTGLP